MVGLFFFRAGQPCDMAFTSVAGHLMESDFEDGYRKASFERPRAPAHCGLWPSIPELCSMFLAAALSRGGCLLACFRLGAQLLFP